MAPSDAGKEWSKYEAIAGENTAGWESYGTSFSQADNRAAVCPKARGRDFRDAPFGRLPESKAGRFWVHEPTVIGAWDTIQR